MVAAIQASSTTFRYYSSGIITDEACGTDADHFVAIVGYGKDAASGLDYFIIQNAWGSTWGEKGYARIAAGPDPSEDPDSKGVCGVRVQLIQPVAAAPSKEI